MTLQTIVLDQELTACIVAHLKPEDVTPNLLSLVKVATITHEHAFHFLRSTTKAAFLRFVENAWEDESEDMGIINTEITKNSLLQNLLKAHEAVQYHAKTFPLITKEAFLNFVSAAFDAGEHQHKVYMCEVEGSVNNEFGVVLNFACGIALFGEHKGLLPVEYRSQKVE